MLCSSSWRSDQRLRRRGIGKSRNSSSIDRWSENRTEGHRSEIEGETEIEVCTFRSRRRTPSIEQRTFCAHTECFHLESFEPKVKPFSFVLDFCIDRPVGRMARTSLEIAHSMSGTSGANLSTDRILLESESAVEEHLRRTSICWSTPQPRSKEPQLTGTRFYALEFSEQRIESLSIEIHARSADLTTKIQGTVDLHGPSTGSIDGRLPWVWFFMARQQDRGEN